MAKTLPPLFGCLEAPFGVFRVVVFNRLILNTRSVERIPKNIKNQLRKLSFLASLWRSLSGNLSMESDEKLVHDTMMWVDGSKTSKRGLATPRSHRI